MAQFKPCRVTSDKLDSLAIKNGQLILVTDTKKIYSDISDTERILVGGDGVMSAAATNYDYFINDLATDYASYSPVLVEWDGTVDNIEQINNIVAAHEQSELVVVYNYEDGLIYECFDLVSYENRAEITMWSFPSKDNVVNSNNFRGKRLDLTDYSNTTTLTEGNIVKTLHYYENTDMSDFYMHYVSYDQIAMRTYVDSLVGDIESVLERLTTGEGV